jgi:hypothetical protein
MVGCLLSWTLWRIYTGCTHVSITLICHSHSGYSVQRILQKLRWRGCVDQIENKLIDSETCQRSDCMPVIIFILDILSQQAEGALFFLPQSRASKTAPIVIGGKSMLHQSRLRPRCRYQIFWETYGATFDYFVWLWRYVNVKDLICLWSGICWVQAGIMGANSGTM